MTTIRVFPRRTRATPIDDLAFIGNPPLIRPEADEVHVSVTFTWDLPEAERLVRAWRQYYPVVKIGGPATGMRGEEFVPGRYLKPGYVITSRGCPNNCWFCSVPKREGNIRELPVTRGWNLLDDNFLATRSVHQIDVFNMLSDQRHQIEFTGGLDAKLFTESHKRTLSELKPKQIFFAYDTPDDYVPVREAARMLVAAGFTINSHVLRCYVLIGYPKDSIIAAQTRLEDVLRLGLTPMAMLYRDQHGKVDLEWRRFQRKWVRPRLIYGAAK